MEGGRAVKKIIKKELVVKEDCSRNHGALHSSQAAWFMACPLASEAPMYVSQVSWSQRFRTSTIQCPCDAQGNIF
jgi:hypothetical protein